jgi:hypothetical protein
MQIGWGSPMEDRRIIRKQIITALIVSLVCLVVFIAGALCVIATDQSTIQLAHRVREALVTFNRQLSNNDTRLRWASYTVKSINLLVVACTMCLALKIGSALHKIAREVEAGANPSSSSALHFSNASQQLAHDAFDEDPEMEEA